MDFLGLINLSIIQDTVNMVKKNRKIDLDMGHIPLDDKKTFDLLGKGMTTTVFQFESPGMQKYLRELKPTRIFDLIAMNALYRPGPIEQIPHFIARKNGKEEIDCYHPDLEQVLGETYGVIVYQEQVMKLAQILGGYTLGGADNIRRIMAKKMPEKMAKLEPEFFEKCLAKGYDKGTRLCSGPPQQAFRKPPGYRLQVLLLHGRCWPVRRHDDLGLVRPVQDIEHPAL